MILPKLWICKIEDSKLLDKIKNHNINQIHLLDTGMFLYETDINVPINQLIDKKIPHI